MANLFQSNLFVSYDFLSIQSSKLERKWKNSARAAGSHNGNHDIKIPLN